MNEFLFLSISLNLISIGAAFIPIQDFYSFGREVEDTGLHANDDESSSLVPISSLFPFFNNQHKSLYVRLILICFSHLMFCLNIKLIESLSQRQCVTVINIHVIIIIENYL